MKLRTSRPRTDSVQLHFETLENRELLDASGLLVTTDLPSLVQWPAEDDLERRQMATADSGSAMAMALGRAASRTEIIFIDAGVTDRDSLLREIRGQTPSISRYEIVHLSAGEDGLTQIGKHLENRHSVDAIHILSHGEADASNWETLGFLLTNYKTTTNLRFPS